MLLVQNGAYAGGFAVARRTAAPFVAHAFVRPRFATRVCVRIAKPVGDEGDGIETEFCARKCNNRLETRLDGKRRRKCSMFNVCDRSCVDQKVAFRNRTYVIFVRLTSKAQVSRVYVLARTFWLSEINTSMYIQNIYYTI